MRDKTFCGVRGKVLLRGRRAYAHLPCQDRGMVSADHAGPRGGGVGRRWSRGGALVDLTRRHSHVLPSSGPGQPAARPHPAVGHVVLRGRDDRVPAHRVAAADDDPPPLSRMPGPTSDGFSCIVGYSVYYGVGDKLASVLFFEWRSVVLYVITICRFTQLRKPGSEFLRT